MNPDREKIFTIKGMDGASCALKIESALIEIMSVAIAVFVPETSELLAVANGIRVARG